MSTAAAHTLIQTDPAEGAQRMADFERRAQRMADLERCAQRNEKRATAATAAGRDALRRLLTLAESHQSGQIQRVAKFLGACWNGRRHFDFYDLRTLDVEISDDMLTVLDALRWAQVGIGELVPGADGRIEKALRAWGMYGEGQTGQAVV